MIFLKTHDDSTPGILVTGNRPVSELLSVLSAHYATPERVVALLSMGNASYIGPSLGDTPHDFDRGADYWQSGISTFFRRDRRAVTSQPTPDELRGVPKLVFNPASGWARQSTAVSQAIAIAAVRGATASLLSPTLDRCGEAVVVAADNYLDFLNLVAPRSVVPATEEEAASPPVRPEQPRHVRPAPTTIDYNALTHGLGTDSERSFTYFHQTRAWAAGGGGGTTS